jgi:DNA-binding HxlR family transcriptional regulator
MPHRSYRQICGVAQALDLIGERWTLLVIRELLLGPKRFGALMNALPGISTNLLSARIRSLVDAGIAEPVELPAPAGVSAYALTERGEALRPTVDSLTLWGFDLVDPLAQSERGWEARASWLAYTLSISAPPAVCGDESIVVNFEVDGDRFVVRCEHGALQVRHGAADDPDGSLSADMETFFAMTQGEQVPEDPAAARILELLAPASPARVLAGA